MRSVTTLLSLAGTTAMMIAAAVGCQEQQNQAKQDPFTGPREETKLNEAMVRSIFSESQRNAIIAEHTIYPHHFELNTDRLNDLGERQVEVLASAYRQGPGPVSVVRGGAADDLYENRVKQVMDRFAEHGVDTSKMTVGEELPGGTIMTSDRAVEVLTPEDRRSERRSGGGGRESDMQVQPSGEEPTRYE